MKKAKYHFDATGRGISLETCTAIGAETHNVSFVTFKYFRSVLLSSHEVIQDWESSGDAWSAQSYCSQVKEGKIK